MKQLRMNNAFQRMKDADLSLKSYVILDNMTNNSHFPSPTPTLADIKLLTDNYTLAIQNALRGDRQLIMQRNGMKEQLIGQLNLLSYYVLHCAAGDEAVAASSGFELSKPRSKRPPLGTPEGLLLRNGINRGELLLTLTRVQSMNNYRYEITECPVTADSEWKPYVRNVSKILFTGLVSGKEYACRVIAYGTDGQSATSGIVTRIAL